MAYSLKNVTIILNVYYDYVYDLKAFNFNNQTRFTSI